MRRLPYILLLLCLLLSVLSPCAFALEAPQLNGKAAVLIDLDSGRVLFGLNMDEERAPASLTKVMTVLLALEALFALWLLYRSGCIKSAAQWSVAVTLLLAAFVPRLLALKYETLDYQDWLRIWLTALRENGAWVGLSKPIWNCNYNVPYLYFLALISKSDIYELLLIKLLSIFFDVLMAYVVMKFVGIFTDSPARRLIAFIGILWLPTVFLNGAYWGQCDVIYASFAVLALYLALSDRPGWSVAAAAISVSFKLQGIFLLPIYPILLFAKKVKIRHLFLFPAVYIAALLPAVLAGRNFWELLTLYYNNTSTIGDGLNYNSSSIYSLIDFSRLPVESAATIGVLLAFFLCGVMYVWFLLRREEISDRAILAAAVVLCLGVPYLLPHMHDRYFFLADVLTFALAVVVPAMSLPALLVSFGSFLGYHAYLRMRFLVPMSWGGVSMLLALLSALGFTAFCFRQPKKLLTNGEDLL